MKLHLATALFLGLVSVDVSALEVSRYNMRSNGCRSCSQSRYRLPPAPKRKSYRGRKAPCSRCTVPRGYLPKYRPVVRRVPRYNAEEEREVDYYPGVRYGYYRDDLYEDEEEEEEYEEDYEEPEEEKKEVTPIAIIPNAERVDWCESTPGEECEADDDI